MEVKRLSKTLGIEDRRTIGRAEELARLCAVKRPMGLGAAEICKAAVCIELASSEFGSEFNRDRAVQLSGSSDKIYQVAMSSIRTMLNIKCSLTARQLAIQFGCLRLEQPTLKLLEEYKNRILSQLHESRKKSFDFDKPVFLVAAFHVQAFRMKVAVDKAKLLSTAAVSDRQFVRVKQSMFEVCFPSLVEQITEKRERIKKTRITRKKVPKGVTVQFRKNEKPEESQEETDSSQTPEVTETVIVSATE